MLAASMPGLQPDSVGFQIPAELLPESGALQANSLLGGWCLLVALAELGACCACCAAGHCVTPQMGQGCNSALEVRAPASVADLP